MPVLTRLFANPGSFTAKSTRMSKRRCALLDTPYDFCVGSSPLTKHYFKASQGIKRSSGALTITRLLGHVAHKLHQKVIFKLLTS